MLSEDIRMDKSASLAFLLAMSIIASGTNQVFAADDIPLGAKTLGYTRKVIDFTPTLDDIAPNGFIDGFKLYDDMFYRRTPATKRKYYHTGGVLTIPNGSMLTTQKRSSTQGDLPYLPGAKGFYVEADFALNSNDRALFSAFWLMPKEHDLAQSDTYPGDPPGYERWMELDVDEGKFSAGTTSSVIDWQGVWDKKTGLYYRDPPDNTVPGSKITNHRSDIPLDRTVRHVFGASYDPRGVGTVRWYLDGKQIAESGNGAAPEIAKKQNFYLIIGNQHPGGSPRYELYLHRLSAWVP